MFAAIVDETSVCTNLQMGCPWQTLIQWAYVDLRQTARQQKRRSKSGEVVETNMARTFAGIANKDTQIEGDKGAASVIDS